MGWFSCYGSRTHEDARDEEQVMVAKGPAAARVAPAKPLASPAQYAKAQHDNFKPNSKVEKPSDQEAPVIASEGTTPTQNSSLPKIQAQTFTFRELAVAAKNFRPDCLVGEVGFGPVFRGTLDNGQAVAIKQLDRNGLQGNREFLVEVLMLSLLHHENLVNLLGYCADGDQRLLVYEFMALGSLEDHLHDLPPDKDPLDWTTRMKIAAGAAKGLEYLHDTANPPVIYRDLKSSNILLGDGFYPKLSDFGLAKLGPTGDKTHVSTRVMGTYGYCAPEYAMTGQLTLKSDVYSFGVVLLELLTGRKAIDQARPSGEQNLVAWARPLFKDRRKFAQMADPRLRGRFPVRGLFQALAVAAMCLHEQAASRPSMADVATALNFLAVQTGDSVQTPTKTTTDAACGERGDIPASPVEDPLLREAPPSRQQVVPLSGSDVQGEMVDVTSQNDRRGADNQSHNTRQAGWRALIEGRDREQAVAEARVWGEAWREKRGPRGIKDAIPPAQTTAC